MQEAWDVHFAEQTFANKFMKAGAQNFPSEFRQNSKSKETSKTAARKFMMSLHTNKINGHN